MSDIEGLICDFLNKHNADIYEKHLMIKRIRKYFYISEKTAIEEYDRWRKEYMKSKDLAINPRRKINKDLYLDKVVNYRAENKGIEEIAKLLNISPSTVYNILKI